MKYILGIPIVNRPDLLQQAVSSVKPLWDHTVIIDNSEEGLDPLDWPVAVFRPPVSLTFTQTMNLLQRFGSAGHCDAVLFMHNDAEAAAGTCERFLEIVEDAVASGLRWGSLSRITTHLPHSVCR